MCTGGSRSRAPQVVYQGPSQAQIDAQNQQMEMARRQSEEANQRMQSQLDQQIAAANADADRARASLAEQTAALAADAISAQAGPYATATSQAAPPPGLALTTEPIKPKKKQAAGLAIAPVGAVTAAGAGLNIGT
jgi:sRNA-binding protein